MLENEKKKVISIRLDDNSFFGGNIALIKRGEESYIRNFKPKKKMQEKMYRFNLPDTFFEKIEEMLVQYPFLELPSDPSRRGGADEAHPRITIKRDDGSEKMVWKWINEKIAAFDPFYEEVLVLIKSIIKHKKPSYKGDFQRDFQEA